ncbi:hypothetical protein DERP_014975 [Dermatophagoides pteronyssinus]|uniref:Uncharacterized protein n=1 Tax=Dermatophagoides pteronyssinus TaxID=6956 RepID=A0ABQ8JGF6_DERPT|nr:hypothetical protein DERP_014975 [Dermatophagoides pteronyssinus]
MVETILSIDRKIYRKLKKEEQIRNFIRQLFSLWKKYLVFNAPSVYRFDFSTKLDIEIDLHF